MRRYCSVAAVLLLLDAEPQRPGEDEATAALRLLARVLARGQSPPARDPFAGKLLALPSAQPAAGGAKQRLDLGDHPACCPTEHRAGGGLGPSALGYRKITASTNWPTSGWRITSTSTILRPWKPSC